MQIQINTDHHIEGHEALSAWAAGEVKTNLSRYNDQITRVEIHLTVDNAHKGRPSDKRCVLEARMAGHQPLVVTEHAESFHQSVTGATDKMTRLIESTLGRASRPTEVLPE